MRQHVERSFHFGKTTALGGLVFLLPLIVVGALIGQAIPIVLEVVAVLKEWLPVSSALGYCLVFALAIGVLIFACFTAGLIARRSIGKRIGATIEKNLLLLFPRYAIFKEQLTGNIGGEFAKGGMKPVLVRLQDMSRLGLEVERGPEGTVTVYLPSAPDPWTGTVALLQADQVMPINAEPAAFMSTFEKLGRDSQQLTGNAVNQDRR